MTSEPVCKCEGVYKSYGRNQVLKGCDLQIHRGELTGLVGENGSGKTTLIRCMLGYTEPSQGAIHLSGRIGYCPQEDVLNHRFTVREHLQLATSIYERHGSVDRAFVKTLVTQFQLEEYLDYLIGDLSGGTRQKVLFLTSILHKPDLLLLDEPYEGFDWRTYLTFWDTLHRIFHSGTAVLIVTHLIHDRDRFDRIYELRGGKIYTERE